MQSFFLAVRVVVPLVAFMGIGGIIRKARWMSVTSFKELNQVVFKVLLSVMVFFNIYQTDLKKDFDLSLLVYAVMSLLVMFGLLWFFVSRKIKDKSMAPVMIQGFYRSNFVLFGLQVTASICGESNLGMTAVLISVIIPMFNVLAVVLFETYRCEKVVVKRLVAGIIRNPLIIASILGVFVSVIRIQFPEVVEEFLNSISRMATPMSLIVLGGTITLSGVKQFWKHTLVCSLGRLIVIPAIFLGIAIMLGYRDVSLVALMVMFGSPTAVSSFPMACQMGGNGELAGQIVAVTTVFSTVTIFVWTYLLSFVGVI